MVGDLPADMESTLLAKLAEQIQSEVDFSMLYGDLIVINDKKYILYDSKRLTFGIKHPKYPYIKITCKLKKI